MKVSVSLPDKDVEFLDDQTSKGAYDSRSAAVQAGIRLLRERELADAYAGAFDDWSATEDESLWNDSAGDGLLGPGA
jgi:Predicted transcriptional regulators containing the CopG/Arc/MetJ DNA-binding domain